MNQPVKVRFDKTFLDFAKEKGAKIGYSQLCDTSTYLEKPIESWGLELPENPTSEMIKYGLTLAHNNLQRQSVIQVIGGALHFDAMQIPDLDQIEAMLEHYPENAWVRSAIEIFQAASAKKATIITSGTQCGIMALISCLYLVSRKVHQEIESSISKFVNFLSRPSQIADLLLPPQLIHVIPAELTIFPKNQWEIAWDKNPELLAPCTGFVVVPGINQWGDDGGLIEETQWWASYIPTLERITAIFSQDRDEVDRTTVLFNGGLLTLAEAYSALLNNSKIIVVEGSGRLADLLAYLGKVDWDVKKIDPDLVEEPKLKSDLGKNQYLLLLERFSALAKKKERLIHTTALGSLGLSNLIEMTLSKNN